MRWLKFASTAVVAAVPFFFVASTASAQEFKIGYVNSERILRDSAPARAATQKLEAEFAKRDRELQEMAQRLKAQAERFDKEAPVMAEADRVRRQRELSETDRELQRRQREEEAGLNPSTPTSTLKNLGAIIGQQRTELAMEVLGLRGLGWDGDGFEDDELDIVDQWLFARCYSIYGGSHEVQNNITALRELNLPKG